MKALFGGVYVCVGVCVGACVGCIMCHVSECMPIPA